MKKTTQIALLLFSLFGFAQEEEFHKMVEAEMKTASKKWNSGLIQTRLIMMLPIPN
jgi:hypothetical protein